MKPQLADNWAPDSILLPTWVQPKIDGVRGLNLTGVLTGRSLKPFKNRTLTARFSDPKYQGLDGELAAGKWTSSSLCRDTTSVVNTVKGSADSIVWWVFDLVTPETVNLPYRDRYKLLKDKVLELVDPCVQLVPRKFVRTAAEVEDFDEHCLSLGFEGTILRNPDAAYKEGRPTKAEQQLMRIKRFTDAEAVVLSITEGRHNLNEATTNELGRTERSSHAENQIPNGLVGSLQCRDCESGLEITVSPGEMDHAERKAYFEDQSQIVGKTITYKSFRKGVKTLPRFPTFKHIRSAEDISTTKD